jgi:hypothetical protein
MKYLDGLWEEGAASRDDTGLRRADDHISFQRGEQWPKRLPPGFIDFTLNLIDDVIQRKAALLTDSRPELQVVSYNEEVNKRQDILEALKKCLQAVWDQLTWGEELARGIGFAEVVGANVGMIAWDPLADNGRGDIRPRFFDPRAFVCDPAVIAATDLQQGEFCGTEEIRTKASLLEQFGDIAWTVRPDGDLSSYPARPRTQAGVLSPTLAGRQFRRRAVERVASQMPRVKTRHLYFKDFQRDARGQPIFYQEGRPARRVIRHVAYAGGEVLVDEKNPAWHGEYPYEILDWGLELDHPYGASEVQKLRRAQETLNKIASQIIKNTILTNNIKVVGDSNALDAEQWDRLTNRPALILRKRQGTTIDFQAPPALPGYLFQLIQFLIKAIEMVSGLGEVTRGTASPAQSGIAIESLAVASQTLIRYQARRLEAFLIRLWSKAIPLVFQHYSSKRVLRLVGPGNKIETYLWDRAALFSGLVTPDDLFTDFVLHIAPNSSLAVAKVQKATLAMQLHRAGLLPGVAVLRAADWPDAESVYEQAQAESAQHQAPTGRGGARALGGRQRVPAGFPAGGPVAVNGH